MVDWDVVVVAEVLESTEDVTFMAVLPEVILVGDRWTLAVRVSTVFTACRLISSNSNEGMRWGDSDLTSREACEGGGVSGRSLSLALSELVSLPI